MNDEKCYKCDTTGQPLRTVRLEGASGQGRNVRMCDECYSVTARTAKLFRGGREETRVAPDGSRVSVIIVQ
jgi:hypothetical protein